MASLKVCEYCGKRYRRSKNRHDGLSFCSDRCRWEARVIPIEMIYKRDDGICHLCLNFVPRNEASRDHVRPKSLGGRMSWENIRLAHASCHSRRGSRPVAEFREILDRMRNSSKSSGVNSAMVGA